MFEEEFMGIREMVLREVNEETRTIKYWGVTESVASDGGILKGDGAQWDRFDANPVFKWNHGDEVIGKVVSREFDKKKKAWAIDVEFAPADVSEFADSRFRLAKSGFLRAVSVGFQVNEFERDLTDDEREKLGLGKWGWVARKWTPHEFSLVPVGADPAALERSIKAGDIRAEDIRMEPKTDPAAEAQVSRETDAELAEKAFRKAERAHEEFVRNAGHIEALEANTKEQQRTQVALAEVAQELSGLREFLANGDELKVAESDADQESNASVADDDENAQLLREIDAIRERVSNRGNREDERSS